MTPADASQPTDIEQRPPYRPPRGLLVTKWLTRRFGSRTLYLLVLAAVIGVGAGYGAILFRELIRIVNAVAYPNGTGVADLAALPWYHLLLVPAAGGLVVGPLIYFFAREAKGHGVPEVMDAVANRGGRIRPRVAGVKILASAVSIGVGAAVGREGPIVQIGSSLGSTLGQLLHVDARTLRVLVGCGAAAGIAATFNAPIAGAIFAIEVILGVGTIATFTPLVVATVVATVISRYHLGDYPAFEVPRYQLVSAWELGPYVLLGVLSALVAVGFSRGLYVVEDLWNRIRVHEAFKPVLGGVVLGGLALVFPHVMGNGYETIGSVLDSDTSLGLTLLLGLVAAKILATHLSLGAGFSGGIFAPSLFIGAMLGGAFGLAANEVMPDGLVAPSGAYALVAMGAVVAAATHAPITVILIVFEMTGDYRMIIPLMLSCLIASALSTRLSRESIYTLKLTRRGSGTRRLDQDEAMRSSPVEPFMKLDPVTIRPETSLSAIVEKSINASGAPLYVTEANGRLCGSIYLEDVSATIRDEDVLEHLLLAADIMRPVLGDVRPDDSLARCLRRMGQYGLEELAVVDDSGRLVGSITHTQILGFYDREVLRKSTDSLTFVEPDDERQAEVVQVSPEEKVTSIPVTDRLAGRTLKSLDLRARFGVHVLGLRHGEAGLRIPDPNEPLQAGDALVVAGPPARITDVERLAGIETT